jgi:hypothetical protein
MYDALSPYLHIASLSLTDTTHLVIWSFRDEVESCKLFLILPLCLTKIDGFFGILMVANSSKTQYEKRTGTSYATVNIRHLCDGSEFGGRGFPFLVFVMPPHRKVTVNLPAGASARFLLRLLSCHRKRIVL